MPYWRRCCSKFYFEEWWIPKKELSQHHCVQLLPNWLNPIHNGGAYICTPLFLNLCLLKSEPITLCLIDFNFYGTVCNQKNICRNLTESQYFGSVVKMDPKQRKTSVVVKWLLWCWFLVLEGLLLSLCYYYPLHNNFLRIWSHLLKKYLMENFIFCAVTTVCTSE